MSKNVISYRRIWAMPNKNTFSIIPIKKFIQKHSIAGKKLDLFPFPYKLDSLEVIKEILDNTIHLIYYDPIYSRRQRYEIYSIKGTDYKSHPEYFNAIEQEIFRVVIPKGIVLKFGWNSKSLPGFEAIDGIIVPHGGQHNDTICTAYEKTQETLF